MSGGLKIRVKFREHSSEDERRQVLDSLAPDAERLFPEDDDPQLASIYVAELANPEAADTLAALKRSGSVEFAEPEPPRRLHLPEELKEE